MLYIRTTAYNAEKTLQRTIDSILNQTYKDFRYYILDNGSKDKTGEIIEKNAKRDSRLVPFWGKVNRVYDDNPDFCFLPQSLKDEDYIVFLDADDYYEPTFLEEMIQFMEENNLDLAACGTRVFNESGEVSKIVQKDRILVLSPEDFNEYFSYYHWNLRQIWGKIYKAKVARLRIETGPTKNAPKAYGWDTYNMLNCMDAVERFGVYPKALHNYYYSTSTSSYSWNDGREESDTILDNVTREFLMKKAGYISLSNELFLNVVYLNAVVDTLQLVLRFIDKQPELWGILVKIVDSDRIKSVLNSRYTIIDNGNSESRYHEVLNSLLKKSFEKIKNGEKSNLELFVKLYKTCYPSLEIFSDHVLYTVANKEVELIENFVLGKFGSVSKYFIDEKKDFTIEEIEFAINLFAFLNNEVLFVKYSKKKIMKLLGDQKYDEARIEISEWMEVLPDDLELNEMMRILEKGYDE